MGKDRQKNVFASEENSLLSSTPRRSEHDSPGDPFGNQVVARSIPNGSGDALTEAAPEAVSRGIFRALRRKKKEKSIDGEGNGSLSIMQRAHSLSLPTVRKRETSAQLPPRSDANGFIPKPNYGGADSGRERFQSAASVSRVSRSEGPDGEQSTEEGSLGRRNRGFSWKNPFSVGNEATSAALPPATHSGPDDPASNGTGVGAAESTASSDTSHRNSSDENHTSMSSQASWLTSTPFGTPVLPLPATPDGIAPVALPTVEKQKAFHRRGRSLSSVFNPLKLGTKGRRTSVAGDDLVDAKTGSAEPRPKTPDTSKRGTSSRAGCFGGGPTEGGDPDSSVATATTEAPTDDGRENMLPAGLVGLRNIGNTCFVNAAVQCLRHTPGLPLALLPDLLTTAAAEAPESQSGSLAASRANSLQDLVTSDGAQTVPINIPAASPGGDAHAPVIIGVVAESDTQVSALAQPEEALPVTPEHAPLTIATGQSPNSPLSQAAPSPLNTSRRASAAAENSAPGLRSPFVDAAAQHNTRPRKAASKLPGGTAAAPLTPGSPEGATLISAARRLSPYEHINLKEAKFRQSPPQPAVAEPEAVADRTFPTEDEESCCHCAVAPQQQQQQQAAAIGGEGCNGVSASGGGSAPSARPPLAPVVAPSPPLKRGELLELFRQLVRDLYRPCRAGHRAVDPTFLVRRLGPLGAPLGEDFTDGRQHDGEEVLSAIVDRLHQDLNRVEVADEDDRNGEEPLATSTLEQEPPSTPPSSSAAAARLAEALLTARMSPATQSRMGSHRLAMADGLRSDSLVLDKDGGYQFMPRSPFAEAASPRSSFQHASTMLPPTVLNSDDMQNSIESQKQQAVNPNETETAKGDRMWAKDLEQDDSLVTDLFGGQLQGNVVCHGCKTRFTSYEFIKGLCLPLASEARSGLSSWFSSRPPPSSITDCLNVFTASETLSGKDKEEYYQCDVCNGKKAATIFTRINRFPRVLILHTKRFVYSGATGVEKVTTYVAFPLRGLRLGGHGSEEVAAALGWTQADTKDKDREASAAAAGPIYDLYAVINHFGTYTTGHYTAACRAPGTKETWHTFNDENVTKISPSQVSTTNAYILFYVRRDI